MSTEESFDERLEKAKQLLREVLSELREVESGGEEAVFISVDRETGVPLVDEEGFFDGNLREDWDPGEGEWRIYVPLYKWEQRRQ